MKLEVKNLSFGYQKGQHLWENVSFTVKKGEIFSILGANGAGKSTLLRSIIGFLHPETGSVFFEDDEGHRYDAFEAGSDFTSHIGYVPQMQDNAYSFALKDYVLLGCAPHLGLFQSPSKEYVLWQRWGFMIEGINLSIRSPAGSNGRQSLRVPFCSSQI